KTDVLEKAGQNEGFERSYRASVDRIESLSIKLPPLTEQQKIVEQIERLETQIAGAKKIMAQTGERRNS
ncbi:MAG: restriction endonuclease subunit S, partial [Treponema sp.]|nr:restriction endonuclease subunit S [Treponema sp.]